MKSIAAVLVLLQIALIVLLPWPLSNLWPFMLLAGTPFAALWTFLGRSLVPLPTDSLARRSTFRVRSALAMAASGSLLLVAPALFGALLGRWLPYWPAVIVNTLLAGLTAGALCGWLAPARPLVHSLGAALTAFGAIALTLSLEAPAASMLGAGYLLYFPLLAAGAWLARPRVDGRGSAA